MSDPTFFEQFVEWASAGAENVPGPNDTLASLALDTDPTKTFQPAEADECDCGDC